MELETLARDCLYLNWALPVSLAPPLPAPLRYEIHDGGDGDDEDCVFASALLFRLSGLRLRRLPWLRVSYPQMNLRLYVLDGEGCPSVLFLRMLVPFWVLPGSRFLARQPAEGARFAYPQPSEDPASEEWRWSIRRDGGLEVTARVSAPSSGGPSLGSWERTVDYFRDRPRGYALWERKLRTIKTSHPAVEVWPLAVEVEDASIVAAAFGAGDDDERFRSLHSAWLCPEIPFVFELGKPMRIPRSVVREVAGEGVPAPG